MTSKRQILEESGLKKTELKSIERELLLSSPSLRRKYLIAAAILLTAFFLPAPAIKWMFPAITGDAYMLTGLVLMLAIYPFLKRFVTNPALAEAIRNREAVKEKPPHVQ